jgi:hypothetical protein
MRAQTLQQSGSSDPTVLEASAVRTTQLRWENEGTSGGYRLISQFQLALWPEINYTTVKIQTVDLQDPTLFHLRSRGEIIYDPDPTDATPGEILAQATIIQTFMVPWQFGTCVTPLPPSTPLLTRLIWELDPTDLGPIPYNVH